MHSPEKSVNLCGDLWPFVPSALQVERMRAMQIETIPSPAERIDRMCELNVIEQVRGADLRSARRFFPARLMGKILISAGIPGLACDSV
jgi:hypothetical protein